MFSFHITHTDPKSGAHTGRLVTPHGEIETPNFIFCATKGAIKGASMEGMKRAGTDIILSNTYHLMLQPGASIVEKLGGLHAMTGWQGPMLTDSGGFQVFSMAFGGFSDEFKASGKTGRPNTVLEISEEGVSFRSYLDGSRHRLTPESSMQLQRQLGADLIMAFDECTAFHHDRDYTAKSLQMTQRWAGRCLREFEKLEERDQGSGIRDLEPNNRSQIPDPRSQALYGIIQGGFFRELREEAAGFINDQAFFGTAVGGSYGKTKNDLYEILSWLSPYLKRELGLGIRDLERGNFTNPKSPIPNPNSARPVHLLGVGDIPDIFHGVRAGIDTFDCVQPTRLGRHGYALLPAEEGGGISLRNARFAGDATPLDPENHHPPTAHYARGYLHHLIKAGEILAIQILVEHNVAVMNRLMREVRAAIRAGTLDAAEKRWMQNLPAEETTRVYGAAR